MSGFIKIHRKLLEHDVAQSDDLLGLWLRILLAANYRECTFRGRKIRPGQFVSTRRNIVERLYKGDHGPSKNTVMRRLKMLEELSLITIQPVTGRIGGTLVTVRNWRRYQSLGLYLDQPEAGSINGAKTDPNQLNGSKSDPNIDPFPDPNTGPNVDPNTGPERKKGKKEKNRKKEDASLSLPFQSEEFQECWRDWETHRKEIKKPLTPTAIKQQHKQMAEWGEAWSIRVMRHTMAQGWQGLREPESEKRPTNNASRVATPEDLANWRPEAVYE